MVRTQQSRLTDRTKPMSFKRHNQEQRDHLFGSTSQSIAGDLDSLVRAAMANPNSDAAAELAEIYTKKQIKKMRQRVKQGKSINSAEDYAATRAKIEKQEMDEDGRLGIKAPHDAYVPVDVRMDVVEEAEPGLYTILKEEGRGAVKAHQTDSLYLSRAIWYNEFDSRHTFNRRFKQCRLVYTILARRQDQGEKLHMLEILYLAACYEFFLTDKEDEWSNVFFTRERFIKFWRKCRFDLQIPRARDWRLFKIFRRDLMDSLPRLEALETITSARAGTAGTFSTGGFRPGPVVPIKGPVAIEGFRSTTGEAVQLRALPIRPYDPLKGKKAVETEDKDIFKTTRSAKVSVYDEDDEDESTMDMAEEDDGMTDDGMSPITRALIEAHQELKKLLARNPADLGNLDTLTLKYLKGFVKEEEESQQEMEDMAKLMGNVKVEIDQRWNKEGDDDD